MYKKCSGMDTKTEQPPPPAKGVQLCDYGAERRKDVGNAIMVRNGKEDKAPCDYGAERGDDRSSANA